MALDMDDKLLGEKTHYYCSSSEGESDEENDCENEGSCSKAQQPTFIPEPELRDNSKHCTNTGPKGVIKDWQRYKQLETEKREEQEKEKQELIKKLSMTCRSHLDDEAEKAKDEKLMRDLEEELDEMEDEFLKEYREKRIEEMRKALQNVPKFGCVYELAADKYVDAIDKENPVVTVIVHLYEESVPGCVAMNGCLQCLAKQYPTVKFCRLKASHAQLSFNFSINGVPALLVYKKGELIGNFVRLSDDFGDDFFAPDVEAFLQEHGLLPESSLVSGIKSSQQQEDSDSDFDLD